MWVLAYPPRGCGHHPRGLCVINIFFFSVHWRSRARELSGESICYLENVSFRCGADGAEFGIETFSFGVSIARASISSSDAAHLCVALPSVCVCVVVVVLCCVWFCVAAASLSTLSSHPDTRWTSSAFPCFCPCCLLLSCDCHSFVLFFGLSQVRKH